MKSWFDTDTGLVHTEAQASNLDLSGTQLIFLPDVLNAPDFPYESGQYDNLDYSEWNIAKFKRCGRWILDLVNYGNPDDYNRPLESKHIARLAILGLSPSRKAISVRFGTLGNFRRAIHSPVGKERSLFAGWSLDSLIHYAQTYTDPLGPPLCEADYDLLYREGKGPSTGTIKDRVGIRNLNDYLGYPDTYSWEKEDFLEWGVRVMQANPNQEITIYFPRILSARRRGPGQTTIYRHWNTWPDLRSEIVTAYENKFGIYRKMLDVGDLPNEFEFDINNGNYGDAARFRLAKECLPSASDGVLLSIARSHLSILTALKSAKPSLRKVDVELAAITIDVFNEVWPGDENWMAYLHVTPEELRLARISARKHVKQST